MAKGSDLRQLKVPDVVQKYRVKCPKASPWVGARPVLGTAPTVPWVGAPHVLWEGVPLCRFPFPACYKVSFSMLLELGQGSCTSVLTEGHFFPASRQPRLGLVSQRESGVRSDAAPLLLSSSVG